MTISAIRIGPLIVGLALMSGGQAFGQVTKKGNAYQFRLKFTKGKTVKLKVSATVPYPGQPKPFTMSTVVAQTVTSISGNVATVSGKIGPTLINGNPIAEKPTETAAKIDSQGKVQGQGASGSSLITYPSAPVKIGSTWNSVVPLSGIGGGNANATFKLLGLKKVNGKQVADLAVTMNSTGAQKTSGSGRMLVLVSDGMPLRMDLKLNVSNPENAGKAIVAPISVIRI